MITILRKLIEKIRGVATEKQAQDGTKKIVAIVKNTDGTYKTEV